MTNKLPPSAFYEIKNPKHFFPAMRSDIKLLHDNARYTTCMTVIMCCIDAIAAGEVEAGSGKFAAFVEKYFPHICEGLSMTVSGKSGGQVLYDKYRNGLCHLRGPKSGFGIAEDHELCGKYTGVIEIEGVCRFMAVNMDRLTNDFLSLLEQLEKDAP